MLFQMRPEKLLEQQPEPNHNRYWSSDMAETPTTPEMRVCEACGASYGRKKGVSNKQHRKSRACSRACSLSLGRAVRKWPSLQQAFWAKVNKSPDHGGCWVWTGCRDSFGYGRINRKDASSVWAHRTSYEMDHGPIPAGMIIRHTCDNPSCVNPAHLLTGTHQDNANDQVERGRSRAPAGEGSPRAKLTEQQVLAIFDDPRKQRDIAAAYGVSQSAIMMIKTKRNWRHLWRAV